MARICRGNDDFARDGHGKQIDRMAVLQTRFAIVFAPLENLVRIDRVLLCQLRYGGVSCEALFDDLTLDLDGPTPPSLTRSVHLFLVGTCLVPTITITYLPILRPDGAKGTLTRVQPNMMVLPRKQCRINALDGVASTG